jgi:hypothetical protein
MEKPTQLQELIERIDIRSLVDELDEAWSLVYALQAKLTLATERAQASSRVSLDDPSSQIDA